MSSAFSVPAFSGELNELNLRNHIQLVRIYLNTKRTRLTENEKKAYLVQSLSNAPQNIRNWIHLHFPLIINASTSFIDLSKKLLEETTSAFQQLTPQEWLSIKQDVGETTSSFILRFAYVGNHLSGAVQEKYIIQALLKNMAPQVATYIQVRGIPPSLEELRKEVQTYESTIGSSAKKDDRTPALESAMCCLIKKVDDLREHLQKKPQQQNHQPQINAIYPLQPFDESASSAFPFPALVQQQSSHQNYFPPFEQSSSAFPAAQNYLPLNPSSSSPALQMHHQPSPSTWNFLPPTPFDQPPSLPPAPPLTNLNSDLLAASAQLSTATSQPKRPNIRYRLDGSLRTCYNCNSPLHTNSHCPLTR